MADFNTYKQRYYVVTAEEETTIVDTETGKTLAVVPAKCQQVIQAIGSKISASGDCVVLPFDKALSLNTVGGQTKSKEVLTAAQTYRLDYADGKTLIDLGGSTYNGYLCYNHTGIKDVTVKGTQNSTSMAYAWYGCNQLDRVTFTDTPEAAQNMAYAFNGCTSLTTLDGLPVDEEGYQVIKCSSSPNQLFYNCPKLAGKYKIEITGIITGDSQFFNCASATLPTTGDLDIKISTTVKSGAVYSSRLALNNPNLHDITIDGVISMNSTLSGAYGPFENTKNLNKVNIICYGNRANGYPFYWGRSFYNSKVREITTDWTQVAGMSTAYPSQLLSLVNCCTNASRLRFWKGYNTTLYSTTLPKRRIAGQRLSGAFDGCVNLTQINLFVWGVPDREMSNAFRKCKLDLPSVQFLSTYSVQNTGSYTTITLGISRYKLAYDTSKNDYFEAGEVKYTDDDKIWYLKADGTETTDTAEAALNDYITTDPAEGAYYDRSSGCYAKGALKDALDTLTGKGYVLTVEYN